MIRQVLFVAVLFAGISAAADDTASAMSLWYTRPADTWLEALPLGNGSLGAMVFGGVEKERIQLNVDTLWSGAAQDPDNPKALEYLDDVRKLLFAGDYEKAERLTMRTQVCSGKGSGQGNGAQDPYGSYQTLGDLTFTFTSPGEVKDYRRALDLASAVQTVAYNAGGVAFKREVFSSVPDKALILRLTADKPGAISFEVRLDRDPIRCSRHGNNNSHIEPFDTREDPDAPVAAQAAGDNALAMAGKAWQGKGLPYAARVVALNEGGAVHANGDTLTVENADAVTLILAGETGYWGDDPAKVCEERCAQAAQKDYKTLLDAHLAEYRPWMDRVALDLGGDEAANKPTDARLLEVHDGGADVALEALYFQYGRYLLIASSRPGTMPANLQGIWCDQFQAPWNCDYHNNINDQMNYWPAETLNLSELHMPFLVFIDSLRDFGRRTAKVHYGARGWVTHTISNPWGFTSPGEHPSWGAFSAAGGWLCEHLWEHYRFTGDKDYLAWAYPIMAESARFYADFLVPEPEHGWLVTAPSNSPENKFRTEDGQAASVCYGPTMDMEIIRELFTNVIQAGELLGKDPEFRAELAEKRDKLAPFQIGKFGQLQEWIKDFDETEPGHRHMSHLYALHPGNQITPWGTPDLAKAARTAIERRLENGGGHTGWSRAWIINFWARLGDGAKAEENFRALLAKSTCPNLFDNHPPFQIDGNFGASAGVGEMLLQSQDGVVRLLPALPAAWSTGQVKGLRARGGHEVSIRWRDGKPLNAEIIAGWESPLRIAGPKNGPVDSLHFEDGVLPFERDAQGNAVVAVTKGQRISVAFAQ